LADRADVDLYGILDISNVGVDTEQLYVERGNRWRVAKDYHPIAAHQALITEAIDKSVISYLFAVDDDFQWSNDRLIRRAQYAQTTAEAAVDMTSIRGGLNTAGDRALDHLARAYTLVLTPESYEIEIVVEENGRRVTRRVVRVDEYQAALFRLSIDSADDAREKLSHSYCANCTDQEARMRAFTTQPVGFELLWSGSIRSEKSDDEHHPDVLEQVLDEIVRAVPALQRAVFVINDRPILSRIGRKEGVKIGRRYKVVRQLDRDGEVVRRKRGYVRANRVTDNRGMAISRSETGVEEILEYEPSRFLQVHGRNVNQMDILVESPDLGLNIQTGYRGGSYHALGLDVLYRVPATVSTLAGVTGELFYEDLATTSSSSLAGHPFAEWVTYRAGLSLAQEVMMARGHFRLMPFVSGSYQESLPIATDTDGVKVSALSYRTGVNATMQLAFSFGLFAGASYQGVFGAEFHDANGDTTDLAWSDLFSYGKGLQVETGIRLNF
jgi:hypothetical protein